MKMMYFGTNCELSLICAILLSTLNSPSGNPTPVPRQCSDICQVECDGQNKVCSANCNDMIRTAVPSECFKINHLKIQYSTIHDISNKTFAKFKNLSWLKMSNNGLEHIEPGSFAQTKLGYIDLSHNELTSMDAAVFQNLRNLTLLDLSNNRIEQLEGWRLPSLKKLYLSHNLISEITRFDNMENVTDLDLSHNEIYYLRINFLGTLGKLVTLKLSHNRIERMHNKAFVYLVNLQELYLDSNNIIVDSFDEYHDRYLFQSQEKLQYLNLSHNKLVSLPNFIFHGTEVSLVKLDVENNQISYIDEYTFIPFVNLNVLNLESNKIDSNSSQVFRSILTRTSAPTVKIYLAENEICTEEPAGLKNFYNVSIFCSPDEMTKEPKEPPGPSATSTEHTAQDEGHKPQDEGHTGDEQEPLNLTIFFVVAVAIVFVFLVILLAVWIRSRSRRVNYSKSVSNIGYNLPTEMCQITPEDPTPPPIPERGSEQAELLMTPDGPYMNGGGTISSNKTTSTTSTAYTKPNSCASYSSCPHRHGHKQSRRWTTKYAKSRPDLTTSESVVIVGINHGGTGKAHMTGLPKAKKHWKTAPRQGYYLERTETKEGKPVGNGDKADETYMVRQETVDGRPKHNTIGACTAIQQ